MTISDDQIDAVARLLAVLGEASRIRIIRALWDGPLTVGAIAEEAGLKQPNASKQLALLLEAGILGRERDGAMVRYHIGLPIVRDLCGMLCDGAMQAEARRALLNAAAGREKHDQSPA